MRLLKYYNTTAPKLKGVFLIMQNESLNFFNKTEGIITLEDKFNYIKTHFKYPL